MGRSVSKDFLYFLARYDERDTIKQSFSDLFQVSSGDVSIKKSIIPNISVIEVLMPSKTSIKSTRNLNVIAINANAAGILSDLENERKVLVTGSAGFIGFHLCKELLELGFEVIGFHALTDYFDVNLKKNRLDILKNFPAQHDIIGNIEDEDLCNKLKEEFEFDTIIHLAAQAGVRYSIEYPKLYPRTNIEGTLQCIGVSQKDQGHALVMCIDIFSLWIQNIHAIFRVTKKSNEVMAHSYSHIYGIPITMFRFLTVYGPWGRPDMALFKFTKAVLDGQPIDIYNHGVMKRDFTYIDDLVNSIVKLSENRPPSFETRTKIPKFYSLSDVVPWRVVNIGNSQPVNLMDYVKALETALNISAKKYA